MIPPYLQSTAQSASTVMTEIGRHAVSTLASMTLAFCSGGAWAQVYLHEEIVDHRQIGKPLCTNCDQELGYFLRYLEKFEAIASTTEPEVTELGDFAGGDFVASRLGFLIHKGCLEEGRWSFNFEQALLDGLVKGMSCLADGERMYGESGRGDRTSTRYSIFPQFVEYLDTNRWKQRVIPYSRKEEGIVLYDSCANVKTDPFFGSTMLDKCSVVADFGNRPKIFCDVDLSYQQLVFKADEQKREQLNRGSAYGSAGSNDPVILNYKGQTKIYNGPTIVFKKNRNKQWSSRLFQSVLFHEIIHNLGYVHHDEKTAEEDLAHNDYAQFCQAACFRDVHPALTDADELLAREKCFSYNTHPDSARLASELKRRM